MTQFGRAMHELNIDVLCTNSASAKRRIERSFGTLQDRLTKEMRLEGICTIKAANAFLPKFLEDHIRRYLGEVVPRNRGVRNEAAVLRAFLRHRLARVSLATLTPAQFTAYRDERLTTVKGATVRREFVILRHCFEIAKGEWSIPLRTNPLKSIELPADSKVRDRRLQENEGLLQTPSIATSGDVLALWHAS
jgi:hypothetical protein